MRKIYIFMLGLFACVSVQGDNVESLMEGLKNIPAESKPGVYWYFIDGNLDKDAMTKDLQSMQDVGISSVIFLEVDMGFAKGPNKFMSEKWQDLFVHAVQEAGKRDISLVLGTGPGWTGSGGPWIEGKDAMKHLMSSKINVSGPKKMSDKLPLPEPYPLTRHISSNEEMLKKRADYYEDIKVLAYPTPRENNLIKDIDEKALYVRDAYASVATLRAYFDEDNFETSQGSNIKLESVIDITDKLNSDGILNWEIPEGDWTIVRYGMRVTGANTRPAPHSGLGFESDKLSKEAISKHFSKYVDLLVKKTGKDNGKAQNWTTIHIDSWEVGAQNWTQNLPEEFKKRRGYNITNYLPILTGSLIKDSNTSERFLWDFRKTIQELLLENHGDFIKEYTAKNGFDFSIEPYDMSFFGDMEFGSRADKPMAEFWFNGYAPDTDTVYTCLEATSIGHTANKKIIGAESFTTHAPEAWRAYPAAMKAQGDWAFCLGINRIFFHTFVHQPLGDEALPGMSLSAHGVHWQRNQPWWNMLRNYHEYIARCSYILQQGSYVASILYLTPEKAPFVFDAPLNSLDNLNNDLLKDKKSYQFDGVTPEILDSAFVRDGKICFEGGAIYNVLVLPNSETMTPKLLKKIESLISEGATIIGNPPLRSPSLQDFPKWDEEITSLSNQIWKGFEGKDFEKISFGKGKIFTGKKLKSENSLYADYNFISEILKSENIAEDFTADTPIRFIHRKIDDLDIYFVSNKLEKEVLANCIFNAGKNKKSVKLYNPNTNEIQAIAFSNSKAQIQFAPFESFFVIIGGADVVDAKQNNAKEFKELANIDTEWIVSFKEEEKKNIPFSKLSSWTEFDDEYIKYYSGVASYKRKFRASDVENIFIEFEDIKHIARVKLNGKELGVLWTPPWRIELKDLKSGENEIEIEVANVWANRLYGDMLNPEKRKLKWENGMLGGVEHTAGKYTFSPCTWQIEQTLKEPLPSGIIGTAKILKKK